MNRIFGSTGGALSHPRNHLMHVFALALVAAVVLLTAMTGTASADRVVRLTLDASTASCTAFDQLDCSYLEARNGNAAAPDPQTGTAPTFLNLANLPSPVTVDATIADDGTMTVDQGGVNFPVYPTTLENGLVGQVAVQISVKQTGAWTGTFDEATGAMDVEAPLGLEFKLNCSPLNGLCGGVFGPQGNMGTWVVDAAGPVDPLTTGALLAPTPPVGYGPEWLGPDVENGSPFDDATDSLTLINNDLVLEYIDASSCVDATSAACTNPGVTGLVAPALNGAIGTVWDSAVPANSLDSAPGAVDMRLEFTLAEPPTVEANPTVLDFPGLNDDGSQPLGTSSAPETITVSAFVLGNLEVGSFFTKGGDEADFIVTSANQCGGWIPAGSDCDIKMRFNPSATGARSSTLFVSVLNPVSGEWETHELTSLTGEGGVLPKGDDGATGVTGATGASGPTGGIGGIGPQGPKGDKGDPGSRGQSGGIVSISSSSKVKLKANGQGQIATVQANGNAVKLTVPKKVGVKIGGRKFQLTIKGPGRIAAGKKAAIKVKAPKAAAKRLKGRKAVLKVKLKVTVGNQSRTQMVRTTLVR